MERIVRMEGHIRPEDVRRSPFLYLPFPVPERTRRLHVSYSYSDPVRAPFGLGPGNTVDIGLFDSRGHGFLDAPGFRGWSGSSKPEFFIAPHEATPGYIRGPLFPGQWHVMLGVDRIEPEGARYEVTVRLEVAEGPDANAPGTRTAGSRPARKADGRSRWVKGDLHSHTVHSDGENTVEELARAAMALGLDFLAITDHNTVTHHEEVEALSGLPIVLIPGEEVTTYFGHANVWGLREWVEFRCADDDAMRAVREYVLRKSGLISVNHPKSVGPPWFFRGWDGYPCMEVWQAPWRFYNWESLERWDALLRRGQRVVAVGGSDTHSVPPARPRHPHGLGNPTTWVWAEGGPSEASILDGIRRGHVFISDAPDGAVLALEADADGDGRFEKMMGDTVAVPEGRRVQFRVHVRGGQDRRLWLLCDGHPLDIIPLDRDDIVFSFSLDPEGHRYVRAELRGYRGNAVRGEVVWAMTNPIWLQPARP